MGILEFFEHLWTTPPSALHQNYVLIGGFILLFGLISLFVKERLYLTESLVATLIGALFGPYGLRIVTPEKWFESDFDYFVSEFSRLIIGLQIMAVGVSVPGEYLKKSWRSIAIMLGPVMVVMWAISAAAIHWTLSLGWLESLIIGACITPTDPVLAHSVIKGKFAERYIPGRLRNLLAVESGANDGLGFPFMMLPVWLLIEKTTGDALFHWIVHTWLWEIIGSVILGFLCGIIARHLLKASIARKLIDKESFLVFSIALTLFVSGLVALMSSDDLLAVFVAGNVFAWDDKFNEAYESSHISEVIDMLFNITFFVFFGSIIPWSSFIAFSIWRLVSCAGLVLLLRRLPIVMLLRPWIGNLQSKKEAFFAGWFGPMGVGAIFFAVQAIRILKEHPAAAISTGYLEKIFTIVSFIVLSSILIHGITVPLTNSHLKRRMKLKVKRRNKLAAQLAGLAEISSAIEPISPTSTETDSDAHNPASPTVTEVEEYIYVTDDEDADQADTLYGPPSEMTSIPEGIMIESGESPRRRKYKQVAVQSSPPGASESTIFE